MIERALLLCPATVTGGPHAIHQLSLALNQRGLPTQIAYYAHDPVQPPIGRDGDSFFARPVGDNPCLKAFARYRPIPISRATLLPELLVVLPEALGHIWARFAPAQVAIWWLAVDSVLNREANALAPAYQGSLSADVLHLCQSAYARDFLAQAGARRVRLLTDYTDETFTALQPSAPPPASAFTYSPRRGFELAMRFLQRPETGRSVPLRGLTRREMIQAFQAAPVHLDFGHFPGKDRTPREAAVAGSVVLVHRKGAGANPEDFPLDDPFKFDAGEIDTGALNRKLTPILSDPAAAWRAQEPFRNRIRREKQQFEREVGEVFLGELALRENERPSEPSGDSGT